ncbi:MAG: AraC family transcriptional regulator [Ruminiclostridium sp.]|nr:AraC family transcriptional regulator [Ruminiclostridium sp.]
MNKKGMNMKQESVNLSNYLATLQVKAIIGDYLVCGDWWKDYNLYPDYYRIYYIVNGEGWIRVGDKDFYPKAGELYWLPSNIAQQYSLVSPDKPLAHYWIHFYAALGGQIPLLDVISMPVVIKLHEDKLIKNIFEDLLSSLNNSFDVADEFMVKSNLLKLMSYYINACGDNVKILSSSPAAELQPIIDHIEKNLSSEMTVNQLAKIINLQPNYFSDKFRKIIGLSPIKYIIQKRIEKAKILLSLSNKQMSEIADETGFSDQFQFSSLFKKYANMSPSEFRNSYKTTNNP